MWSHLFPATSSVLQQVLGTDMASPHPGSTALVGFWDEGRLCRLEALLQGFPSPVTGVGHTEHQEWLDWEGSASLGVTRAEGNCWEQ